jgi:hypothetical protein
MMTNESYGAEIERLKAICRQKDQRIVEAEEKLERALKINERMREQMASLREKILNVVGTLFE